MTTETVYVDKPGDHDVRLTGADAGTVMIGSRVAALLSIETPCRLPTSPAESIEPPSPS